MAIYKRCSRCGKRLLAGNSCSCAKRRHREYDQYYRDKKSKKIYSGGMWEHARNEALRLDGGIDVYVYMTKGEIVIADTVHHIIPLKDDWGLAYDIDNLMSLHHDTHSIIEQEYKKDKKKIQTELTAMLREFRSNARGGAV